MRGWVWGRGDRGTRRRGDKAKGDKVRGDKETREM